VIPAQTIFVNGGLEIHYEEQEVYLDHKRLHLTPLEYRLIVLFSKNPGKVLTRNYITKQIWNSTFESDMSNLRVYMTMLRKKLDHRFIETNFGVGYKMVRDIFSSRRILGLVKKWFEKKIAVDARSRRFQPQFY